MLPLQARVPLHQDRSGDACRYFNPGLCTGLQDNGIPRVDAVGAAYLPAGVRVGLWQLAPKPFRRLIASNDWDGGTIYQRHLPASGLDCLYVTVKEVAPEDHVGAKAFDYVEGHGVLARSKPD